MSLIPINNDAKSIMPTASDRPIWSRRGFICTLSASGVAILMPACKRDDDAPEMAHAFKFFRPDEVVTLLSIAEIMIPQTDTAGATEAGVIPYIDSMLPGWASKSTSDNLNAVVSLIDEAAIKAYAKTFNELSGKLQETLLTYMDAASFSGVNPPYAAAYKKLKSLIFHVYYTSEVSNGDYVPVPGIYKGDISKSEMEALIQENAY